MLLAVAGWADVISAVLRNTILQSTVPERFRSRMSSIQMAVVQGGPRLGDMESGTVAALTSVEFSVISGGLVSIAGAVVITRCCRPCATTSPGTPTTSPYDPGVSDTFAEPTWGEVDPGAFARIVVVSPHFDDAAMGAGHLIASYPDTTVVTVLAGRPPAYPDPPSEWDALGGFVAGDDVVAVRREEDVAAMAVLESDYRWLDFPDHQYLAPADRPTAADVAPVLAATLDEIDPTSVFFPMGLGNPDHVMVHDTCLLVRTMQPGAPGSATRTTATSTSRACWPGGCPSSCARSPGRRRPSSPTSPTRTASGGPSGPTPRRSRRSSATMRSVPEWRAGCPSSSGVWRRHPRAGSSWPT